MQTGWYCGGKTFLPELTHLAVESADHKEVS